MAQLLLLHHALGLTHSVRRLAAAWRDAGHDVHTPDLYDGHVFGTIPEGVAYAQSQGFSAVAAKGEDAASDLSPGFVVCGLSLGVMPAMRLGVSNDAVSGVVAVGSCVPPSFLEAPWPRDVPLRIIASRDDPFFRDEGDLEAAQELVATAANARLKLMPGAEHLFMEAKDPLSRAATERLYEVVLRLLEKADSSQPESADDDSPGDDFAWDLP